MKLHLPRSLYKTLLGASLSVSMLPAEGNDYIVTGTGINQTESLSLSQYENVQFVGIEKESERWAKGGAVNISQTGQSFSVSQAQVVQLENNATIADMGSCGAAVSCSNIVFSDNGELRIVNNKAASETWMARGGALETSSLSATGNEKMLVQGNAASVAEHGGCTIVDGGSIWASSINISQNGAVSFVGNYAALNDVADLWGTFSYVRGGAIESGSLTFVGNESVEFLNNYVVNDTPEGEAMGGAIYCSGWITMSGNVHFRGNYEDVGGYRQMRSIYMTSSYSSLNLSAGTDEEIRFDDSIHCDGSAKWNMGTTGTIIFSGAHIVEDLGLLIPNPETDEYYREELNDSFASEIVGGVTLGGGLLRVEDGARLSLGSLSVLNDARIAVGPDSELKLSENNTTLPYLTLGGGVITLGTEDHHEATLFSEHLVVTADSTVNADLNIMTGSIVFDTMATVTLGCSVTIGDGVVIMLSDDIISGMKSGNSSAFCLFESAESVSLGDVVLQNSRGEILDESWVLDLDNHGRIRLVPEPATTTLSLFALCGLMAVRRRRSSGRSEQNMPSENSRERLFR